MVGQRGSKGLETSRFSSLNASTDRIDGDAPKVHADGKSSSNKPGRSSLTWQKSSGSIKHNRPQRPSLLLSDFDDMSALTSDDVPPSLGPLSAREVRSSSMGEKLVLTPNTDSNRRASMRMKSLDLDMCNLRIDQLPLFGRRDELEILQNMVDSLQNPRVLASESETSEAFTQNATKPKRGLVMIQGMSGSGKTSLAMELEPMMKRRKGLFAMSKCEEGIEDLFACIEDCLDALCRKISLLPLRRQDDATSRTSFESSSGGRQSGGSVYTSGRSGESDGSQPFSRRTNPLYLDDFRDKLREELDEVDKEVLIPLLPTLSGILELPQEFITAPDGTISNDLEPGKNINKVKSKDATTYQEDASKLLYAYRHLVRIIARICPVALLIDDCQWADPASINWIKQLVAENSITTVAGKRGGNAGSVIVAVCYRSNEVDEHHELIKMERDLEASKAKILEDDISSQSFLLKDILIENLSLDDINDLLSELLSCPDKNETRKLAQVVHQKTLGNAFFVVQLLMRMQEDELLFFNLSLMRWTWKDVDTINANYLSTDNVGDLMRQKFLKHEQASECLPIAACLGSSFMFEQLEEVVKAMGRPFKVDAVDQSLQACLKDGFLELVGDMKGNVNTRVCRFVHDKIREAALDFADDKLKIQLGNVLLDLIASEKDKFGDLVYAAIPLLAMQMDKLEYKDPKRIQIIKMNALAGRKALECSAFDVALAYLKRTVMHIAEDPFAEDASLSLDIYTMVAAAEFVTGNNEDLEGHCETILSRDDYSILDKVPICITLMEYYNRTVNSDANFKLGLKMLRRLGRRFPKTSLAVTARTLSGLIGAKVKLKKKLSKKNIEKQVITSDPKVLATMKLLDIFASTVYHAKPAMLPLVLLESTRVSEEFGLNAYSGAAYAFVGLIFAGVLEDFETAKVCGEAGEMIMRKCNNPITFSRTLMLVYGLCLHWTMPIKNCLKPLREGYEMGMKSGQLSSECAFGNIHFYMLMCFCSGMPLATIYGDYKIYTSQMEDCGAMQALAMTSPNGRIITRLRGMPDEMDEEAILTLAREKKFDTIECFVRHQQIWLGCFLGDHEEGATIAIEWTPKIMKLLAGMYIVLEAVFVSCICAMSVVRKTKDKKMLKHAMIWRKKIKSWVAKGNPNCVAHDALLEAEERAMENSKALALRNFEVAVLLAGRRGLTHLQALANERSAVYLEEVGDIDEAKYRYEQAQNLYTDWGATVKVEQVQRARDRLEAQ